MTEDLGLEAFAYLSPAGKFEHDGRVERLGPGHRIVQLAAS